LSASPPSKCKLSLLFLLSPSDLSSPPDLSLLSLPKERRERSGERAERDREGERAERDQREIITKDIG